MAKPAKKGAKAQSKLPSYASNTVTVKVPTGKRTADGKVEKREEDITSHENGVTCLDYVTDTVLSQFCCKVDDKGVIVLDTESNYRLMKILTRSGQFFTTGDQLKDAIAIMKEAMTVFIKDGMPLHGKDGGAVDVAPKGNVTGADKKFGTKSKYAVKRKR